MQEASRPDRCHTFAAIQLTVLFGGHDHVLRTEGLTYAEYARGGFAQLLAVALLTLAVIAAAVRGAGRRKDAGRPSSRRCSVCCACSPSSWLASALRRLGLYEDAFGYTLARLGGLVASVWVGAVLALVMAAGLLRRGDWLPRALVATTAAGLLALSVANPEGIVAERNVERFERTGMVDLAYLRSLGPDAAPALARLPPERARCALAPGRARYPRRRLAVRGEPRALRRPTGDRAPARAPRRQRVPVSRPMLTVGEPVARLAAPATALDAAPRVSSSNRVSHRGHRRARWLRAVHPRTLATAHVLSRGSRLPRSRRERRGCWERC